MLFRLKSNVSRMESETFLVVCLPVGSGMTQTLMIRVLLDSISVDDAYIGMHI